MKIELLKEENNNEAENIASGKYNSVEAINKNNNTQVDIINKYIFQILWKHFNGIEYIAKYLQDSTTTDIMIMMDPFGWKTLKGWKNVKENLNLWHTN